MTTKQINCNNLSIENQRALAENLLRNKLNRDNFQYLLDLKSAVIAAQGKRLIEMEARNLELERENLQLKEMAKVLKVDKGESDD